VPDADAHLPVLVYDGDCGLCQAAVRLLERRVRPPVRSVAWQRSDLDALGLAPEEAQRAVCLVEPWGAVRTGAGAVAAVLCAAGGAWAIAGGALGLPGLRRAGEATYEAVARHRHRFAPLLRSAPACATPAPAAAPTRTASPTPTAGPDPGARPGAATGPGAVTGSGAVTRSGAVTGSARG
jgi:predicted DCC family thiol-disulfide oxidoreductase YuxK